MITKPCNTYLLSYCFTLRNFRGEQISFSLLLVYGIGYSQQVISTNQFSVEANHNTLFVFSINQLDSLVNKNIGDLIMVNSKGEEKVYARM